MSGQRREPRVDPLRRARAASRPSPSISPTSGNATVPAAPTSILATRRWDTRRPRSAAGPRHRADTPPPAPARAQRGRQQQKDQRLASPRDSARTGSGGGAPPAARRPRSRASTPIVEPSTNFIAASLSVPTAASRARAAPRRARAEPARRPPEQRRRSRPPPGPAAPQPVEAQVSRPPARIGRPAGEGVGEVAAVHDLQPRRPSGELAHRPAQRRLAVRHLEHRPRHAAAGVLDEAQERPARSRQRRTPAAAQTR